MELEELLALRAECEAIIDDLQNEFMNLYRLHYLATAACGEEVLKASESDMLALLDRRDAELKRITNALETVNFLIAQRQ